MFADGLPVTLDSSNYHEAVDKVLAIGYDDFAAEQERARAEGRYLGLGVAAASRRRAWEAYEGAHVQVSRSAARCSWPRA
ncbi:MAG: hypothetical protein U0S48_05750 [Solirubrobacteraceae bacterium]